MSELDELYREVIIDHGRSPRNRHALEGETVVSQEGYNPLCGDRLTLYLDLRDGVVADAGFTGEGCAISTASASLLTERVQGLSVADADALFARFRAVMTDAPLPAGEAPELEALEVLEGVRAYPMRVKCATLAWHTLHALLAGDDEAPATTE